MDVTAQAIAKPEDTVPTASDTMEKKLTRKYIRIGGACVSVVISNRLFVFAVPSR
jgi:hypothetical protein